MANLAALDLYALKPWYGRRLRRVRSVLLDRGTSPSVVSWAGVAVAALAGTALALLQPGLLAGAVVAVLLAARLACANLDGALARESGRCSAAGSVTNEVTDRVADLAVLAGCFALAPAAWVLGAMLAASAPSWVALAQAAAGRPRVNGGPGGKTERCVLLVLVAVTGTVLPLLALVVLLSLVTAGRRLRTGTVGGAR
jgi:CDP-diacylglycerol--glycerol-3-phosphate 3-phosphatidyltransferase